MDRTEPGVKVIAQRVRRHVLSEEVIGDQRQDGARDVDGKPVGCGDTSALRRPSWSGLRQSRKVDAVPASAFKRQGSPSPRFFACQQQSPERREFGSMNLTSPWPTHAVKSVAGYNRSHTRLTCSV